MSMIEEYQQAGFTCIEGLFNKDEVHDLQLATDELIEESRCLTNNTLFLQQLSENLRY